MKVLFLASYFPKPDNPVMGTWALSQAQAIAAHPDVELLVVSFTSAVPSFLARSPGAKAYADCPLEHDWEGGVKVLYPRWLYYPINPVKKWMYGNPAPYLAIAERSAQPELIRIIEKFQPDIYFCHHSLPNGWLIKHLPEKYQRPLFLLEHDFDEIRDCYHLPKRQQAFAKVANHAEYLMAVSKPMEADMQALFPAARTATLHNGIHLPPPELVKNPRPPEIQGKQVILVCAFFAERKAIPLLIQAFAEIAPQHPDALLRIVGSGPQADIIQQTVQDLAIASQVQLIGKQTHDRVLQEMAWADCFALVGYNEPFATVYLEAMAAGKPIICCSDGGITDVIQNQEHGLIVPPGDRPATAQALDQILSQPHQRQQMGINARQLIEKSLTWEKQTQLLIQQFQSTLHQP